MTSSLDLSPWAVDLREGALVGGIARAALRGELGSLMQPLSVLPGDAGAAALGPRPEVDRAALAAALQEDNRSRGHARAEELGAKLADPATRVVVTGQQVGLFGGPLYTFTKALAATLWARRIEAETGESAVAVFWMATEDHDYAEVAQGFLPALETPRFQLDEDAQRLVPVGGRRLGTEPGDLLEAWAAKLGHRPDAMARLQSLRSWYREESTWGGAFAELMIAALGDACPLLLDAQLPELKTQQIPWHRSLLERRVEVDAVFDRAREQVEAAGFSPRTRRVAGETPLFFVDADGARRRICFDGDAYSLRGSEERGTIEQLLERLESSPQHFTPGALSRALVADAVLGSSLQILGPGEVAYMAEAAPLYDLLGVTAPRIAQRPQAALVPSRWTSRLVELADCGLTPKVLVGAEKEIEARLAARAGEDPVEAALPEIEALLDQLGERCCEEDPQLEKPAQKTRSAVLGALQKLRAKSTASRARQDQTLASRATSLRWTLFPGAPQDRVVTAAHYFVEQDGFGDWFAESLDLDPRSLQLLALPG